MKTEIEWTDDGRSKEYSRDEARVLMAVPENIGTLWIPSHNRSGLPVTMNPLGYVQKVRPSGGEWSREVIISKWDYHCIGCRTCYPDAPDETECPGCGRPLQGCPRYFINKPDQEHGDLDDIIWYRRDSDGSRYRCEKNGEIVATDMLCDERFVREITEQEAQELREEALYPRVFVAKKPDKYNSVCCICETEHKYTLIDITGNSWHRDCVGAPMRLKRLGYTEITGHYTAEELLEGAGRERCSRCDGRGRVCNSCLKGLCQHRPECKGDHVVRMVCPRCDGTGVEPDDAETTESNSYHPWSDEDCPADTEVEYWKMRYREARQEAHKLVEAVKGMANISGDAPYIDIFSRMAKAIELARDIEGHDAVEGGE